MEKIIFIGYLVNAKGIEMDEAKIKAIQEWSTPATVSEVRSFYDLASFYIRFFKDFSTLTAPLTKIMKKMVGFKSDDDQEKTFNLLKKMLIIAPLLVLPNLTKTFEIECDALGIGIEAVLMQEKQSIAYFNEKLNGATLNYQTYDKRVVCICEDLRDLELLS